MRLYIDIRLAQTLFIAGRKNGITMSEKLYESEIYIARRAIEYGSKIKMLLEILSDHLIYDCGYNIETIEKEYTAADEHFFVGGVGLISKESFENLYDVLLLVCKTIDEERGEIL
jgi:hypothetical protein